MFVNLLFDMIWTTSFMTIYILYQIWQCVLFSNKIFTQEICLYAWEQGRRMCQYTQSEVWAGRAYSCPQPRPRTGYADTAFNLYSNLITRHPNSHMYIWWNRGYQTMIRHTNNLMHVENISMPSHIKNPMFPCPCEELGLSADMIWHHSTWEGWALFFTYRFKYDFECIVAK